jgi:hypothetical protein
VETTGQDASFPQNFLDWQGRAVVLRSDRWNHIITQHPELTGRIAVVITTVQDPLIVTEDKDHPQRQCLYHLAQRLSFSAGAYLKVCVEYETSPAVVITAYLTNRIPVKETVLWTR